ncbi:MAG: alpha-1,4-glucan--maltose-1-phosphate maltosyltransferase, partial [Planctomycetota bacterium]
RRDNPALQQDRTLRFHDTENPALLCYSKSSPDGDNVVVCIVNTNPYDAEEGIVRLDADALGLASDEPLSLHDQLTGSRYTWRGDRHFVRLDPEVVPAHVFRVDRRHRSERDFEYF